MCVRHEAHGNAMYDTVTLESEGAAGLTQEQF
jgi:hypothetical protein